MSTHRNYCERCASVHESVDCPASRKDNALHLMEGQGLSDEQIMEIGNRHFKPEPDLNEKTKAAFLAAVRECIAATAKTAHAHWVDEVEASGEAEKHAARCEVCDGSGRVVQTIDVDVPGHNRAGSYSVTVTCDACQGDGRVNDGESVGEAEKHAARLQSMRFQAEKFKALYEKSQELFARERGITKELAAAFQSVLDAYVLMLWMEDSPKSEIEAMPRVANARAALAKVQP